MKKNFFTVIFAVLILTGCVKYDDPSDYFTGEDSVASITDSEIKAAFDDTNSFRTGSEAWYWNSDDSTKTDLTGTLSALTFDEKLAKAAAIRAEEIASSFSHTRPDGTTCYTVLAEVGASCGAYGENIAAGYRTGNSVVLGWREDDDSYSGQGHRRNMLSSDFKKIGIAYYDKSGSTYGRYWAMELSD